MGGGWTDIENSEATKKGEPNEEIDLDDMMTAQVVEEKVQAEDDDEDMEPIDIDAENEAMDSGTNIFASGNYVAVDID